MNAVFLGIWSNLWVNSRNPKQKQRSYYFIPGWTAIPPEGLNFQTPFPVEFPKQACVWQLEASTQIVHSTEVLFLGTRSLSPSAYSFIVSQLGRTLLAYLCIFKFIVFSLWHWYLAPKPTPPCPPPWPLTEWTVWCNRGPQSLLLGWSRCSATEARL